jgi:hypothetical protein
METMFERFGESKRQKLVPHAGGYRLGEFDLRPVGSMWVGVHVSKQGVTLWAFATVPYEKR